jgi:hypothetical protein
LLAAGARAAHATAVVAVWSLAPAAAKCETTHVACFHVH